MRTAGSALLLAWLSLACVNSAPDAGTSDPAPASAPAPAELEGPAPASEPAAAPAEDGLCSLAAPSEWSTCDGQRVRIQGRAPTMVMQHPMRNQPEGLSPDGRNTHQGYMDTDRAQMIILTKAPFNCSGEMTVVGTLREIKASGDPGVKGKDSYGGWSLEDAEVTCG
jgi:hypothetical protein